MCNRNNATTCGCGLQKNIDVVTTGGIFRTTACHSSFEATIAGIEARGVWPETLEDCSTVLHPIIHLVPGAPDGEARCIVCGCVDSRACAAGCGWSAVNYPAGVGVCDACESDPGTACEHLRRYLAGTAGHDG